MVTGKSRTSYGLIVADLTTSRQTILTCQDSSPCRYQVSSKSATSLLCHCNGIWESRRHDTTDTGDFPRAVSQCMRTFNAHPLQSCNQIAVKMRNHYFIRSPLFTSCHGCCIVCIIRNEYTKIALHILKGNRLYSG